MLDDEIARGRVRLEGGRYSLRREAFDPAVLDALARLEAESATHMHMRR